MFVQGQVRPSRRRVALFAIVGLFASVLAIALSPPQTAHAAITTPTPGSTVAGTVEIHENHGGSNGTALFVIPCSGAYVRVQVHRIVNGLTADLVFEASRVHPPGNAGSGSNPNPTSFFWDSDGEANGQYRIRAWTANTSGGLSCSGASGETLRGDFTVTLENGVYGKAALPASHIGGEPITFAVSTVDDEGRPVSNADLTVEVEGLDDQTQTVTTDDDASAEVTFAIPHMAAGSLGVTMTTSGDGEFFAGRTTSATLNVSGRPTEITWTGDVQAFPDSDIFLQARLSDATPDSELYGQPVVGVPLTIDFQGETVTGTTGADGRISALSHVSGTPRYEDIVTTFDGDDFWNAASRLTVFMIGDDIAASSPTSHGLLGGLLGLVNNILTQPSQSVNTVLVLVDSLVPNAGLADLIGDVSGPTELDDITASLFGQVAADLVGLGATVDEVLDELLGELSDLPLVGELIDTLSYQWRTVYLTPEGERVRKTFSPSVLGVPQPLDVDGDGLADLLATLTLRITQGDEAGLGGLPLIPTIRVQRLANAPADLPISIEAILSGGGLIGVGDGDGQMRFGYDTRHSNAPQGFEARLGLATGGFVLDVYSDGDEPITVSGAIEGAGMDLPFGGGDADLDAIGEGETRFAISFDPAPTAARIGLGLGGGDAGLGANFRTNRPTEVGIAFVQDNGVDESFAFDALFDAIDGGLSLVVDAGEAAEDSIAPALGLQLSGDNALDRFEVNGLGLSNGHITTDLRLAIADLPTQLHFDSADGGVDLVGSDTIGVFEAGFASGGRIVYLDDEDRYLNMQSDGDFQSVALRLVGLNSVTADLGESLGLTIDASPGKLRAVVAADGLAVDASIFEAPQLLSLGAAADGAFVIEGSEKIDLILMTVSDDSGILLGATDVSVRIQDVPGLLSVGLDDEAMAFETGGNAVGLLEIFATSGPDPTLPGTGDGLRLVVDEDAGEFVLATRIHGLRTIVADVDLTSPSFIIDTETNNLFDVDIEAFGMEITGFIDHLVPNMSIGVLTDDDGEMAGLRYSADEPTNEVSFSVSGFADFQATNPVPTSMEFGMGDVMLVHASDFFTLNLQAELGGIEANVDDLRVRWMEFGAPLDGGDDDTDGIPVFMNTTEFNDTDCVDGCTYPIPSGEVVLGPIDLGGINAFLTFRPEGFAARNGEVVVEIEQDGLGANVTLLESSGDIHCTNDTYMKAQATVLFITVTVHLDDEAVCLNSTNLADLVESSTVAAAAVEAGDDVVHTFTARNDGPAPAADVRIDGTFEGDLGDPDVTCSGGGVADIDTDEGTAECVFAGSTAVNTQRSMTLTWTTDEDDVGASAGSAFVATSSTTGTSAAGSAATTVYTTVAELTVVNIDATPMVIAGDEDIVHRVEVGNLGPSVATNLSISGETEGAPAAASVVCSDDGVAAGESCAWADDTEVSETRWAEFTWSIPTGTPTGSVDVSYTATSDADALDATASASTAIVAERADIAIVDADGTDDARLFEPVVHSATVGNSGPSDALNVRALADYDGALGAPVVSCSNDGIPGLFPEISRARCIWPGITPVGGEHTIDLTWDNTDSSVDFPAIQTTTFTGTSSTPGTNGTGSVSTLIEDQLTAHLEVAGTSAPETTGAGTDVVHFFTVVNDGPDAAENLVITAALPGADVIAAPAVTCSGGGVADLDGDSATCTYPGDTAVEAQATMTLTWAAADVIGLAPGEVIAVDYTAASDTFGIGTAGSTSTVATPVSANLTLVAVSAPENSADGLDVVHEVTIGNAGPAVAGGLTIDATLSSPIPPALACSPGGVADLDGGAGTASCSYPSTAVGQERTMTLTWDAGDVAGLTDGEVLAADYLASAVTNGVDVTTSTSTVKATAFTELEFTAVNIGETGLLQTGFNRSVEVTSHGPAISDVVVDFELSHPSNVTCPGGGVVSGSGTTTPSCVYSSLPAGASRTVNLNMSTAQVNAVGPHGIATVDATASAPLAIEPATMQAETEFARTQLVVQNANVPAEVQETEALAQAVTVRPTAQGTNNSGKQVQNLTIVATVDGDSPLPNSGSCSGTGSFTDLGGGDFECLWTQLTPSTCTSGFFGSCTANQDRTITLNWSQATIEDAGVGAVVTTTVVASGQNPEGVFGVAPTVFSTTIVEESEPPPLPPATMEIIGVTGPVTHEIGSGDIAYVIETRNAGPTAVNPFQILVAHDGSLGTPTVSCAGGTATPSVDGGDLARCQWGNTTSGTARTMTITFAVPAEADPATFDLDILVTSTSGTVAITEAAITTSTALVAPEPDPEDEDDDDDEGEDDDDDDDEGEEP